MLSSRQSQGVVQPDTGGDSGTVRRPFRQKVRDGIRVGRDDPFEDAASRPACWAATVIAVMSAAMVETDAGISRDTAERLLAQSPPWACCAGSPAREGFGCGRQRSEDAGGAFSDLSAARRDRATERSSSRMNAVEDGDCLAAPTRCRQPRGRHGHSRSLRHAQEWAFCDRSLGDRWPADISSLFRKGDCQGRLAESCRPGNSGSHIGH